MFRSVCVFYLAVVRRVRRGLQKIFNEINGIVQEIVVGAATINVQFAS
jgi:hypothetical protein